MSSLAKAVPGVANAFLIMVIIMCIYAILAVEFFSDFGNEGSYITFQDHKSRGIEAAWSLDVNGVILENRTVSSMTARGFTFGEEYYGTFMRALYTLFQVLTLTPTLTPTVTLTPTLTLTSTPTLTPTLTLTRWAAARAAAGAAASR